MKPLIKKSFRVLLLALGLVFLYNVPTLISLSKPIIIRATSGSINNISKPSADLNHLVYPALGINLPFKELAGISPIDPKDWPAIRSQLTEGGALTSSLGVNMLIAHSADSYPHSYSAVFAPLGQVKINDEFVLNKDGSLQIYKVIETRVINPNKPDDYFKKWAGNNQILALVTCWPPLTTTNRLVVVGKALN